MNASLPNDPEWDGWIKVDLQDTPSVSGGEYWAEGHHYEEYNLDFGAVTVGGLSSEQALVLAVDLVNHLLLNGHEFMFRKGTHQDQPIIFSERL